MPLCKLRDRPARLEREAFTERAQKEDAERSAGAGAESTVQFDAEERRQPYRRRVTEPVIHFAERNLRGLSYPREVIGNVWKFLTSPIAIARVSGRRKARNKLRF